MADLEENSRVTRDMLNGEPDPAKYNEIFEKLTGTPDICSNTFEPVKNVAKIYEDTFINIFSNRMKSYPISASAV